ELSAGSVVRGMFRGAKTAPTAPTANRARQRPSLISFRMGNETLVSALADKLGSVLSCDASVASISIVDHGFQIKTRNCSRPEGLQCDRLVLATPTQVTALLLADVAPEAAGFLGEIAYAPVAVVSVAYRREQVRHSLQGFGFLIPRSAGIRTLGTVWNSSQF